MKCDIGLLHLNKWLYQDGAIFTHWNVIYALRWIELITFCLNEILCLCVHLIVTNMIFLVIHSYFIQFQIALDPNQTRWFTLTKMESLMGDYGMITSFLYRTCEFLMSEICMNLNNNLQEGIVISSCSLNPIFWTSLVLM